jgi:hypothetical protein
MSITNKIIKLKWLKYLCLRYIIYNVDVKIIDLICYWLKSIYFNKNQMNTTSISEIK